MKATPWLIARITVLAVLWIAMFGPGMAQTVTILHNFGDGSVANDGEGPSQLTSATDGFFYGSSSSGGPNNFGTVFKMSPQGSVTILSGFSFGVGIEPSGGVLEGQDGNFYGIVVNGGANEAGAVYKLTPQGVLSSLFSLPSTNGGPPELSLGADGNFYGSYSTDIYRLSPQGVFENLTDLGTNLRGNSIDPFGPLVQGADGNFYGTTDSGGVNGSGSAFQMTPLGVVTTLHSFNFTDGNFPVANLVQGSDGNFYGTTEDGGSAGHGVIFKVTPQGNETVMHNFGDGSVMNDGNSPRTSLIQGLDGNFYGTTNAGGVAGEGTIFEMTPQGVMTILYSFSGLGTPTGASSLVEAAPGVFYGTTQTGGTAGFGFAFELVVTYPNVTSASTASGNVGLPFTFQVTGSNTPTSFSATGLPNGLSISTDGLITGTPTATGTTPVTLTLTNGTGSSTFPLTISISPLPVPGVTSILTAYGSLNVPFTYQTVATNIPTSYSATGLTNTGLSIDPTTGIISGTPTTAGPISVSLMASNSVGAGNASTLTIQIFSMPPMLTQEYSAVYRFPASGGYGTQPNSILQAFDGNFYGVTESGGGGEGTIFELTVQGNLFPFYYFTGANGVSDPETLLQAADGSFYGTTVGGAIFRVTTSGQLSALYNFGSVRLNALIQGLDGNFYGTAQVGGSASEGVAFQMTSQGTVKILHNFDDGSVTGDGEQPNALVQGSDGNFYGTTNAGGAKSGGTAFKMTPQGVVTILHPFAQTTTDGASPAAALIQGVDGNFYGTTSVGGTAGKGTVFAMTMAGVVSILHNFGDNSVTGDGSDPIAALLQGNDGNFYGTTLNGGANGSGTVFELMLPGALTVLHTFGDPTVFNDGASPNTALIQSSAGNFYGTTQAGGVSGGGTVYSIIPTEAPTHVPVFTGAAFAVSGIYTPLTFTPKAAFGVSGSQALTGSAIQAPTTGSGLMASLVSWLTSSPVHKNFSQTNWTLTQGTTPSTMLPNDLMFDSTSGTISGTPVEAGIFTFSMTPNNAVGSGAPQTVTLYIDVPPGINSGLTETAAVGAPFTYQIATTPPADSYGATALPAWLSIDTSSGIISGTPPGGGSYVFNAVAANVSGQSVQTVLLNVSGSAAGSPAITSPTMATGAVGTAFTYQITTTPAAASFTALALPTGLFISPTTGLIFGTPTGYGTFSIPLTATNAAGTNASRLSLTIAPLTAPGLAASLSATSVAGAPFSYYIPATGPVESYTASGLPTGVTCDPASGVISGTVAATGTYLIDLTVGNSIGTSSSTLTLNVVEPTGFSLWESAHGFMGGPMAAPKADGVANLLKYVFDLNPNVPVSAVERSALPTEGSTMIDSMPYQTLTYREYPAITGVTVHVETSPDLDAWTTMTNPTIVQTGTDAGTGDPIMQVQMPMPTSGSAPFIRLQVTQP